MDSTIGLTSSSYHSMGDSIIDARRPLTGQEVRLLEVYPSRFADDALRCRRFQINLDAIEMYPYEALSYVWGDESNQTRIICDGSPVSVTTSLADALKKLRLPERSRLIWADALCIDQTNALEKNCQIPIMGEIYSMAERVVVWLGEVDSAQREGVHIVVQHIANCVRRIRAEGGFDEDSMEGYEAVQIPDDYLTTATQAALRRFYSIPWFSRIWCIQEIVLAQDAIMLWGEHEFLWADVGMIAAWLHEIVPERALEYDTDAFYADIDAGNAYDMYRFQRTPNGLLELLEYCNFFKASNPRDRVYGLLALVEPKEEAKALCVDYNKSVGEVYADTVVAWIQLYRNLTPLSFAHYDRAFHRSLESFTSWTPKWDTFQALRQIPAHGSSLSACKKIPVKSVDASKINSQRLCLKGIQYREVTNVYGIMDIDTLEDHKKHPFVDCYHVIVGQLDPDITEMPPMLHVLARTLTAGGNSSRADITTASMEEQWIFSLSLLALVVYHAAGVDYTARRNELLPQETFYDEAEIVCMNRRLFKTENEDFGLGPESMREGDVIVVLFGGDAPLVLRPNDESYLFIGQAYVDDLMQGQLIDAMEAGTAHEQEFCLV
jgi:hypothetical protein